MHKRSWIGDSELIDEAIMKIVDIVILAARLCPIKIATAILPILFYPSATNGFPQADLGPPATVVTGLKSGDERNQAYLAGLLGLRQSGSGLNYRDCDIRANATKLDAHDKISVLQVWCDSELNIVVLKEHGGLSEVLASRYFLVTRDHSRIELASLIHPTSQELVIHNVSVPSNTHQSHFLVLRLVKAHLEVIFSGIESGIDTRAGDKPCKLSTTFTILPASGSQSGRIVEEAAAVGSHSYVVHRSFSWSEDWQAFVEDGVFGVEATGLSERN